MPATTPKEDFRSAAAEEGERLLKDLRAQGAGFGDPVEAGISYCLKAEEDATAFIRSQRLLASVGFFGFLGAMLTAVVVGILVERSDACSQQYKSLITTLALLFGVSGAVMFVVGIIAGNRRLRHHLKAHRPQFFEDGPESIVLGLEDTKTYNKMKSLPDDMIVILAHPESRCVQIEGVSYRYLIYADDVLVLKQSSGQNTHAVQVKYRIGRQTLDITIVPTGLWNEFKRQLLGGKGALYWRLHRILSSGEVAAE